MKSTDRLGNRVVRVFNNQNQLITEYVKVALPASSNYNNERLTQYAYDSMSRLRFTVSNDHRVTEYRYDAAGNQSTVILYANQTYSGSNNETALSTWVNSIADKSTTQRTDFSYDLRGQVSTITAWSKLSVAGVGIDDGAQSITRMVYDQAGQLLQTIAASGLITTSTYDGFGRTLSTTDNAGSATTAVYDDTGRRVLTTQANGLASTSVFNQAGELVSVVRSDNDGALGESRFWYDADGRLRITQDPTGAKHALMYDAAGRETGEIDVAGRLTEYHYNPNGDRTQSITYATMVAPLSFMERTLDLGAADNAAVLGQALKLTIDAVRPTASAQDLKTWTLYDAEDRLSWQIDALGFATQTLYDGESRVYGTNRLVTPIDVSLLKDGSCARLTCAATYARCPSG